MYKKRHSMLTSLLLVSGSALAIGYLINFPGWAVASAIFFWALYQIQQFNRLSEWLLNREELSEPPEGAGHWGEVFDGLSRLSRRQTSREKLLRKVINRFQESTAALPDAIVIVDTNNNLEWWNSAASHILGLNDRSDRGQPVINLLRDPRFIRYFKRDDYSEPITIPSPANSNLQVQLQITHFGEGDRLLVARDVTRIQRLEQTRQDFVANASHELRTPLTVIKGYLETFLDHELSKPLERGLNSMQQQAQRMENLVSDLLLLSRLESSHQVADEQPIQIQEMASNMLEAAEQLSEGLGGHKLVLEVDERHDLIGQELELHSAFSNLIYNAIRYTPAGGRVRIRFWVDQNGAHFSVKDNGSGIDSIHLPRLTERFYRVDASRSSASGGTGLGLAIVKHVLARHSAQLTIKSKLNKGSNFTCHFPTEAVIARARQATDTKPIASSQ